MAKLIKDEELARSAGKSRRNSSYGEITEEDLQLYEQVFEGE